MSRNLTVTIELTPKQAERLADHAVGLDMCSDDKHLADTMRKVWKAVRTAQEETAAEPQPNMKPCSRCGRDVVHNRRGRGLAFAHKCPHGETCERNAINRSVPRCRACRALKGPPTVAPETSPETQG